MTRQEIDRIYDNTIHGDGQNEYRGDIFHTVSGDIKPKGLTEGAVGPNVLTPDMMRGIVNDMSADRAYLMDEYNNAHPDNPYRNPNTGTPLPDVALGKFFSDYDRSDYEDEGISDYLYNNPQEKGLADYFADNGALGWLYDQSLSGAQQDALLRDFNMARGLNDYQRQKNLDEFAKRYRYGEFLGDLLKEREENPDLYDFDISAHPKERESVKPSARQRYDANGNPISVRR